MRIYLTALIVISIIHVGFAIIPKCPHAWYPNTNDPNSTSCYLITQKIKRSWQDAQTFCEYMDGSLFKIDSVSERTWIFNILKQLHAGFPSKSEWWIGLHDNPRQTDYIWIDKSQPDQSLLPWAPGEQSDFDRTKACIEYYNGTLRHQDCSAPQYFVCERPQSNAIWCDALNRWENINNKCYKIQSKLLTWDDARSQCQRENGDLFVANDRASEFVLHNYLEARRSDLWIGLRAYQNATGAVTYRWDGSRGRALQLGSTSDYFGVQHPEQAVISSNGSVSCVIANHTFTTPKLWQPTDCSVRSFSICQKPEGRCSAGWIQNGYNCYNIETRQKLTWTAANSYCQGLGAQLLKIRGPFTQMFINSNLAALSSRGIDSIWFGLSDNNQDGNSWTWGDNSTFVMSPYMYNNLPDGKLPVNRQGQRDCFTIYTADSNGTWQLANNCSETKAFVCTLVVGQRPTLPTSASATSSPAVTSGHSYWSTECGLFWVKDNTTGYCYRFSDNTMTWFQASAQCKGLGFGSQLASINTMHDQHFVGDRLFGYQSPGLWIGVNNLNRHSGYQWNDGSAFGYLNWAPGEPNNMNSNEHCGEMITGGSKQGMWNDIPCNIQRGYICKKPSPSMTTIPMTTLAPTPAGNFYGCPGTLWLPYKGNCYLFSKTRVSWQTASMYCQSKGGSMASIVDENEQNFVFSQLPGKIDRSQYWIGFNDIKTQMSFQWLDGSPVLYTNWAENEPNNWMSRKEDCVGIFLKDGTWNDYTCEDPQSGFICKAKKSLKPVGTVQADLGVGCSVRNSLALGYYCYLLQQSAKQWESAQANCLATGGNLAVIHDRYQQAFLASQIALTGGNYWIGLGTGGVYVSQNWVTAEKLGYTAWSAEYTTSNTTANNQSTCVAMKTQGPGVGLWVTPNCTTANKYICQYDRAGYSTPLTTTTTAAPTCPDGWHLNNGYCYKGYGGSSNKKTWFEARDFCEAMGADLLSVHSRAEENFAFSYTVTNSWSYGSSFWIGLNDFDVEKGYKWTDGSVYRYKNWGAGEPNDFLGTDDCVEYNKNPGYWNDNNCYVAKPFVCKILLGKQLKTAFTTVAPTLPDLTSCACQYSAIFTASCAGTPDWYPFNGSCYYVSPRWGTNSRVSWFVARNYCLQHGGDLASVHSEQENGFITTLLSKTVALNSWLGMTDLGVNQFGFSDGTPFDYEKWIPDEPNDAFGSEKCGQIFAYNGYWNDNDCNENYNFICKRPQGTVQPHTPAPTALISGGCPHGYTGVHKGNKCFKVIGAQKSDRKNYTMARDDCRGDGGDIASISSRLEQVTLISMISGLFSDDIALWIGLNDRNRNNKYTFQDSSQLLMTNWAKGQPSYGGGHCVEMYTDQRRAGKWHNVDCSLTRGYICEATRNTTLPTAAPAQGMCPDGFLQNPQMDCLKVHPTPMNWTQAKTSCESEHSSLVSILNVFDQAFVDVITADITTPVWTGLADQALTGTYSWVDNWGVYYTSWDKNEPTYTAGEGCVATHNGYWNDTMCSNSYPFICKKSFFKPPTPTAIPSGYCKDVSWKQFENSCYYINSRGYSSWSSAERGCKTLGMELASILSRNEEMFILRELDNTPGSSTNVWIGFKKTNGYFSWTDGSAASYMNWDVGQPSDLKSTSSECVELKHTSGKWNDRTCYSYNGYVCKTAKLPATSPPPSTTTVSPPPTTATSSRSMLPSGFVIITASPPNTVASRSPSVTSKPQVSSKSVSQVSTKSASQVSSKSGSPFTMKSGSSYTTYRATPRADPQGQSQSDLSSGQVAGVVIGVILVLVLVCVALIFLKHYYGDRLFNFARLRGNPGFDNACYDKSNEEVTINNEQEKTNGHVSVSNGNNLNFAKFEADA